MQSFDQFIHTPLAHRGLHDALLEENSLGAFKAAVAHGYGIEMDVHIMKDGRLAVVHDSNLKRVTGHDIRVEDLTVNDLAKYPLKVGGELIPTFEQLLEVVAGKVPLLIELKVEGKFNPEDPRLPATVLKALENYPKTDRIAIQSFNPYAMRWLHDQKAPYPLGQLASPKLEGQTKFVEWMFRSLNVLRISKADFIAFDILYIPSRPLARHRRHGTPTLSWTVDSDEKLARARKYVDNVIFEKIRP